MAVVKYDTNPELSVDEKLQSLVRSIQLALNEKSSGAGGAGSIGGLSQAQLKKLVDTQIKARNQEMYIVGTILSNTTGQNPAEYLGFGTWVEWGKGKVPVGVDSSDPTFATSELQGGSKNAPMLKHTHAIDGHSHTMDHGHNFTPPSVSGGGIINGITGGSHSHNAKIEMSAASGSARRHLASDGSFTSGYIDSSEHLHNLPSHTHTVSGGGVVGYSGKTASAGGGNTGSWGDEESVANKNLQPYITCYMWKRTA